jgi:hypothetical protein
VCILADVTFTLIFIKKLYTRALKTAYGSGTLGYTDCYDKWWYIKFAKEKKKKRYPGQPVQQLMLPLLPLPLLTLLLLLRAGLPFPLLYLLVPHALVLHALRILVVRLHVLVLLVLVLHTLVLLVVVLHVLRMLVLVVLALVLHVLGMIVLVLPLFWRLLPWLLRIRLLPSRRLLLGLHTSLPPHPPLRVLVRRLLLLPRGEPHQLLLPLLPQFRLPRPLLLLVAVAVHLLLLLLPMVLHRLLFPRLLRQRRWRRLLLLKQAIAFLFYH